MRKLPFQNLLRLPLTVAAPAPSEQALAELSARVDRAARRRLGRSLSIREVDAGSCNGCELEIHALSNAFYDLELFGFHVVASPRHADVLLVTGPVTANMREALERTYAGTNLCRHTRPEVGRCRWRLWAGRRGICWELCLRRWGVGGVAEVIPVDLHIPGCPPNPIQLLEGLLALLQVQ